MVCLGCDRTLIEDLYRFTAATKTSWKVMEVLALNSPSSECGFTSHHFATCFSEDGKWVENMGRKYGSPNVANVQPRNSRLGSWPVPKKIAAAEARSSKTPAPTQGIQTVCPNDMGLSKKWG